MHNPVRDYFRIALGAGFLLATTAGPVVGAALPTGFTDTLVTAVGSPTALAFTPDGRLLVTQQPGQLRVFQGGALLATPAISFPATKICNNSERGLLGVAVDPNFAINQYVYLYYTFNKNNTCVTNNASDPVNRVSRFTLPDSNVIDLASEMVLLDNMPSNAGNHNGGDLLFGKDGYLYVTIGDGGCSYADFSKCAGANQASRDQNVLTGKLMRIATDGSVPPTNPFQGAGTARCNVAGRTTAGMKCQETYAWGFRNPFRLAVDPNAAGTRVFVNDVGQDAWEEIDLITAGSDYGWNCREGANVNSTIGACTPTPSGMVDPIFQYAHNATVPGTASSGCNAITGGAFVPNGLWPGFDGRYLFSDFICGSIFTLTQGGGGSFSAGDFATGLGGSSAVELLFGPFGNAQALYYTTYAGGGQVRRISYGIAGNNAPTAVAHANPTTGAVPLTAVFDATGSSDPDAGDTLTYFWDFGDGTPVTATTSATTSHPYATEGAYTATLRARDNRFAFSPPVTVDLFLASGPHDFFTLTPCRLVDTRNAAGPQGGPALVAGAPRSFTATGSCGIPGGAVAIAVNLTVVTPGSAGGLRVFPAGAAVPTPDALRFRQGVNRSNNAVVALGTGGAISILPAATGATHVIVDVVGYFQ